jgi:2-polyprenyl-3-methyl-5-hydroxy-6-metoxy-1,4-benzoquinol methylase
MQYTGERIIPEHAGKAGQGNIDIHDLMYREFLVAVENKLVLDIACGCGMGTKMLASRALRVHGYDIDKESIDFAKEHYNALNIKYDVGDIKQIPEIDSLFDTVVSVETFEHVEEVEKVISEVYRVLKPNGIWCFTTPNGERYPDHKIVKYHVKHYTEKELHSLLDSKFEIYVRKTGLEPDMTVYFKRPTFGNYSVFGVKK